MRFHRAVLGIVAVVACSSPNPQALRAAQEPNGRADGSSVQAVSVVQLLAAPERYEGKRVRVKGFCQLGFETNGLFLHREDFEIANTDNGLWLDVEGSKVVDQTLDRNYVLVEGRFSGQSRGHLGLWNGAIGDVTRFERVLTRAESAAVDYVMKMSPK